MALVYADVGSRERALDHLRIALDVWEEADPGFKPAERTRETLAELTTGP